MSRRGQPRDPGDDIIIGKAFLWSVAASVGFAGLAALAWLLLREPSPAEHALHEDSYRVPPSLPIMPTVPFIRFTDITADSGIAFTQENGARGARLLPETMGGGNAFFDYDNDGDADVLLVDAHPWPQDGVADPRPGTLRLFANDGRGHFEDVTEDSGLDIIRAYGMGVAVGDYDGDGLRDIFVTALGKNRLLRNRGGRFVEVTDAAGVGGKASSWSTAAVFFDYDADGDLDLFVGNYVEWSREVDFEVDYRLTGIGRAYGPPSGFAGSDPYLYRNLGAGRFEDVSDAAGIRIANRATGKATGKVLGALALDVDGDGDLDLVVANDTVGNFVFRNDAGKGFVESGAELGLAFNRDGQATGAMGIDAAWYRNDGDLAIAIGNFANEMTSLYVAPGGRLPYIDQGVVDGLGASTRLPLTFGLFFFDADLDGRLDLLQVNGHIEPDIARVQSAQHYRQAPQLFWNCGPACGYTYVEVPAAKLGDLATPLVGRGAAYADIDADGDLDILVTQAGGATRLYRNDQDSGHHWLRVRLRDHPPNIDALGAIVEVYAAGTVQRRAVMPARSYLSQVELPLTFGLGTDGLLERIVVHWPDGERQEVTPAVIDGTLMIERAGRKTR